MNWVFEPDLFTYKDKVYVLFVLFRQASVEVCFTLLSVSCNVTFI